MKKSILIGAIAALMLFAFVACDSGSNVGYITGVKAEANADKVYLPGETVDLSDYSFTLLSYDGSEAAASASDFVTKGADDLVVPQSGDFAPTVYYKGNTEWGVDLDVNVGKVKEVSVDASKIAEKTYYVPFVESTDAENYKKYTTDLIDLEGAVITAKYADENDVEGTREIAIDNKYVSAALSAWTKGPQTATVTYAGVVSTDTYSVTVEDNLIVSVKLELTNPNAKYYVGSTVSTSALKMVATYVNGETQDMTTASTTTFLFRNADEKYTATSVTIDTKTPATRTVYAQYVGKNQATTLDPNASFSFEIRENRVTGVGAVIKDSLTLYAGKDYSNSVSTDIANHLTVKYTYETTNTSATELVYGTDYSISSSVNFTNARVNQKVPVTVEAGGYSYTLYVDLQQDPEADA